LASSSHRRVVCLWWKNSKRLKRDLRGPVWWPKDEEKRRMAERILAWL